MTCKCGHAKEFHEHDDAYRYDCSIEDCACILYAEETQDYS